jgi:hypothetical protein
VSGTGLYTECTLIMPDGSQHPNKAVKAIRLMSVEDALAALRSNHAAWVRPGDVQTVVEQFAGQV